MGLRSAWRAKVTITAGDPSESRARPALLSVALLTRLSPRGLFEEPHSGDDNGGSLDSFIVANEKDAYEASSSPSSSASIPPDRQPSQAERKRNRFCWSSSYSESEPESSGEDDGEPLVLSVRSPSTIDAGPSTSQARGKLRGLRRASEPPVSDGIDGRKGKGKGKAGASKGKGIMTLDAGPSTSQARGKQQVPRRVSNSVVISDDDDVEGNKAEAEGEAGLSRKREAFRKALRRERKTVRSKRKLVIGLNRIAEAQADPAKRKRLNKKKRVVTQADGEDSGSDSDPNGWNVGRTLPDDNPSDDSGGDDGNDGQVQWDDEVTQLWIHECVCSRGRDFKGSAEIQCLNGLCRRWVYEDCMKKIFKKDFNRDTFICPRCR